jgi:hypothetical protein
VFLGAFRREALAHVGGYDEHFVRAQDWELNFRLRAAGYAVWFVPEMQVAYRPRRSWRALARQFHHSGRWRRAVVRQHPSTASPRYLAAPILVVALAAGVVLAIIGVIAGDAWVALLGLSAPLAYVAGVLVAAVSLARQSGWRAAARMPGVLATMHLAWGTGFLRGVR